MPVARVTAGLNLQSGDRFLVLYGAMLGLSVEQTRVCQEAKEEGLEQGRREGKLEGKLELVPRMLARAFTVEEVAELLGLEVEQVRHPSRRPNKQVNRKKLNYVKNCLARIKLEVLKCQAPT